MKKIFKLTAPSKAPERQVDSVKHEINKYITRERRKKLPEGVDFWDFDCHIGNDEESLVNIHVSEINKSIDSLVDKQCGHFMIQILAKPGYRGPKLKK